ncbi:esterase/lipase family protein [Solilutibacter silvestris]|uniref:Alpha/beta hydrolase n=1 Tax=Solilutibacter silvestris TaxID=1645665 RepID=A0A2K1Q2S8_9GAMM|nr:alpha/beta hydrolase [Lysobacter silvestris]PNS09345.1 Alpha/beta hydrolase [Lysobacter silvestris]
MSRPRVVLLHGLWMHAPAMHWFASRLRGHGFDVAPIGYFSVLESTTSAVSRIMRALDERPGTHLVGHSLGGLLALQAATRSQPGRVVCLGSPLAGSRAADGVASRVPAGRSLIGQHHELLFQGAGALPAGIEVGMIAGTLPRGLGGVIARLPGPHDGTVAVEETRVPGLAGHVVVEASHSGLIFCREAADHAACFLRAGRFEETAALTAIA